MSKRSNKKSSHVARSPLLPDDDSDGRSVQSEQRGADSEEDSKETNHEFKLEDLIENLSEKRATARVAALKAFCGELRAKYSKDALSGRLDTVQSRIESCLRKGASDEIVQASTALALVVITLGADAERTHKEFYELLHTMLLDQAKSVTARAAIARTYSLSLFIAGDEGETEKELQLMLDLATDRRNYANGPDLVTAALQAWALIASTLPLSVIGTRLFSQFTPRFAALLDEESLEVRSAAGEVLALLYSQHREWQEERQTEDSAATDAVIDVNALTDKLEELSTEGAKHIAKETRKKQRQVFRDILATFEEGEVPAETMTVGQRKHTFRGWANARRLDSLRAVLEAGLSVHLKQNELMGQVFEISVSAEEEDDETRAARRADLIEASKAKEKAAYERDTKQRKKKAAAVMHEDE